MHVYIYDSFVSDRKYEKITARIETRITDLGLNGKIIRLGASTNVYNTIENEIKRGAKTIVVVGDNSIYSQSINTMGRLSSFGIITKNVPLGFIPLETNNSKIASYFGISNYEEACNFISARRIESIKLGMANDHFFLTHAKISCPGTLLEIDNNYTIEINELGEIYAINMATNIKLPQIVSFNTYSSSLELYIKTTRKQKFYFTNNTNSLSSALPFKTLLVSNKNYPVILDDSIQIKTPVTIRRSNEQIHLIIGKTNK